MQREKVNIDEKLLTQIANETGGHYYRAKDNESLKKHLFRDRQAGKIEDRSDYTPAIYRTILSLCTGCRSIPLLELLLKWTLLRKFP
jgi:Ca-activated chloride channel family protein